MIHIEELKGAEELDQAVGQPLGERHSPFLLWNDRAEYGRGRKNDEQRQRQFHGAEKTPEHMAFFF
jgi:hypothetical protein